LSDNTKGDGAASGAVAPDSPPPGDVQMAPLKLDESTPPVHLHLVPTSSQLAPTVKVHTMLTGDGLLASRGRHAMRLRVSHGDQLSELGSIRVLGQSEAAGAPADHEAAVDGEPGAELRGRPFSPSQQSLPPAHHGARGELLSPTLLGATTPLHLQVTSRPMSLMGSRRSSVDQRVSPFQLELMAEEGASRVGPPCAADAVQRELMSDVGEASALDGTARPLSSSNRCSPSSHLHRLVPLPLSSVDAAGGAMSARRRSSSSPPPLLPPLPIDETKHEMPGAITSPVGPTSVNYKAMQAAAAAAVSKEGQGPATPEAAALPARTAAAAAVDADPLAHGGAARGVSGRRSSRGEHAEMIQMFVSSPDLAPSLRPPSRRGSRSQMQQLQLSGVTSPVINPASPSGTAVPTMTLVAEAESIFAAAMNELSDATRSVTPPVQLLSGASSRNTRRRVSAGDVFHVRRNSGSLLHSPPSPHLSASSPPLGVQQQQSPPLLHRRGSGSFKPSAGIVRLNARRHSADGPLQLDGPASVAAASALASSTTASTSERTLAWSPEHGAVQVRASTPLASTPRHLHSGTLMPPLHPKANAGAGVAAATLATQSPVRSTPIRA
jgi:hypothetical protein